MITRREAIAKKVFELLCAISTANGDAIDFDGKYHFRVGKNDEEKKMIFHLRDVRNRHDLEKQYLDFEIAIISRNGDRNYNKINVATTEILSALFSGIATLRSIYGNQCRWIPEDQNFEIEFTADYMQAETTIKISLLHYVGDSLFEVDVTDYAPPIYHKIFKTADGKTFKTADEKTIKLPDKEL